MSSLSETVVALYERHARDYDRDRGRSLFERPWLDRFVALVPKGGTVLDIGCGTGEPIARHLLERGLEVTGVDAAEAMISLCRARFPGREWIVQDMRGLSLGRTFRGLVAWDSFFHLSPEAQREMFPVFRAHAAPGAALLFTSGPAAGEAVGRYCGEPLYHASLDAAEYRDLLEANGFQVVRHVAEDPDCGGRTLWLARQGGAA
jgi:SAM-dependent methyltransferase